MQANNLNVTNALTNAVIPKQHRFLVTFSAKEPSRCVICGAFAKCRHFGAVCCNACAAFFRRALLRNKNYSCAQNNNCVIDFTLTRRICSACRLRKCVAAGMNKFRRIPPQSETQNQQQTSQLRDFSLLTTFNNSIMLPRIQKFDHSAQFSIYENNKWLQELVFLTKSIEHQRLTHLPPSPYPLREVGYMPTMFVQFINEINFCQMFLHATDIINCGGDLVNEKFTDIVSYWTNLTCIMNTLKNDCLQDRKLSAVDHSKIEMSESSIRTWYATFPLYHKHLDSITKASSPIWFKIADLITKIYNLRMTNEEQAFFLFLGLIKDITRLTSEPKEMRLRFQPMLNTAFRSIHAYFRANFTRDSMAMRIGNLIMALPILDEINKLFSEIQILASLCYSKSQVVDLLTAFRNEIEKAQSIN